MIRFFFFVVLSLIFLSWFSVIDRSCSSSDSRCFKDIFSGSISRISAFFLFVGWVCRTTNLVFATEKIPISLLAVTEGRVEVLVIIRVAFFGRVPCGSKKVRVLPRWFTLLFYSFFVVEVKLSNFIDMFLGLFDFCVVDLELFLIVLIIGEL